jgi:hypothetical protein
MLLSTPLTRPGSVDGKEYVGNSHLLTGLVLGVPSARSAWAVGPVNDRQGSVPI